MIPNMVQTVKFNAYVRVRPIFGWSEIHTADGYVLAGAMPVYTRHGPVLPVKVKERGSELWAIQGKFPLCNMSRATWVREDECLVIVHKSQVIDRKSDNAPV